MGQFHAGVDRLGRPEKGCLEKSRTYLAETGWTSPLPGGGLVEALHRRSKVDGTIPRVWLAKQPRRRSPWTSRKRLHFLNSLQGPGCLAKSALSCLVWLASGYQKKRFGWLLAGFWLAFWLDIPLLKLAGPPRCLGGLVEALPLPQTKQSRWHNSTYGLAKQPRRRSPWTSRKRLHFLNSLQGPKSALSCLVWLASGYQKKVWLLAGFWLVAGFLVAHPPAWKNLVLTWLKLAGPPRCLGAALWRHCPSHKRSNVDGTIPRVGLRSSPGVDRLGPEKGCASLTPCKAQAALPNQPSLAWFGWLLAIKKRGLVGFWLSKKEVWLVGHPPAWKNLVLTWLKLAGPPAAWGRPCGGTAPPTNEAK